MKFLEFLKLCFNTISPDNKFMNNWHIKVLADRLDATLQGKINYLLINMPPRSMKSICISVAWPAWILGLNPSSKIIVASYSQILSEKLSLDTRYILQSKWYQQLFPNVILSKDQNTKSKFQTTQHGYRFATSIGGSITGEGGNILILDDPMNLIQSASKVYRQKVCYWFDQSFITRMNNRKNGIVIIVMHRLHSEDLSYHVLSKPNYGKWHHLSIPMLSEKKTVIYSLVLPYIIKANKKKRNILYIREEGEFLYKKKSQKYIKDLKFDLGTYAFSAQYQQSPVNISNGVIKRKWIKRYKYDCKCESFITQSWDTANSSNKGSNFSVCTTWSQVKGSFFLLEVYRARIEYPLLKKQVITLAQYWHPNAILIEVKASGIQLIQELSDAALSIIKINPVNSKMARLYQVIPIIESGRVFLPYNSVWLDDFEQEILSFPNTQYDDQLDSMTQYLYWASNVINNTHPYLQMRQL
ncbi:phage terminase large subunit [Neoehrlichia mikurensis]|uniref:Phage terminase large subunit n=1 Tax=Neoehrlichia mikurensis TaxID=89586 RepID=A0A9Q9BSC9_9RICK|nr:phage terminase large subunit [Neoehrlichia mikurensis]QXK91945.1 phage terminase large subunit [Neoehrlichia mikurensis]QXK93158.1 phage terminase large subunit [Neoehrlichia mikurensis]QXK93637.1 phage terminase large subunit [Neoehrlichia mikurensis]UTO55407.1 phage terminase large subunit [Neoehrlichia mikurensis]UTO56326.1 phage terminase large subunit [Neoehrlichia mikurensis]